MLSYSNKPISGIELWIPLIMIGLIGIPLTEYLQTQKVTGINILIIIVLTVVLLVGFLFPKVFYHLRVDFGNIRTAMLWLLPLALLGFGFYQQFRLLNILIVMYAYFHLMRILHYATVKQIPAYSAHWTTVNKYDRFAERRVSRDDIGFAVCYSIIPLITLIIYTWIKEVYY